MKQDKLIVGMLFRHRGYGNTFKVVRIEGDKVIGLPIEKSLDERVKKLEIEFKLSEVIR